MTGTRRAVVVGSGPNGLAAALTLQRAGVDVEVLERSGAPGGGCRTEALTLPGFRHDVCAAVVPFVAASPFFRSVDLAAHGVNLLTPATSFAHPLDGGRAVVATTSLAETAAAFGDDGPAYHRLLHPFVDKADDVVATALAPLRSLPRPPVLAARFGALALRPASGIARRFRTEEARALFAGAAAHSMLRLDAPVSGGVALLMLLLAHTSGWPVVEGGVERLTAALLAELAADGCQVHTSHEVTDLRDLEADRVLLDVTPRQLVALAGTTLSATRRLLAGRFRYGPGVFKVDFALRGPVPWEAAACRDAVTLHLGGSAAEIAAAEAAVATGVHPERPFVIVVQPSVIDPGRAPAGAATLWAYCHVPSGSTVDMTDRIEAQIERFAPGFSERVLCRSVKDAVAMEEYNPNYVGGDIAGGAGTFTKTLFGPALALDPYGTGIDGCYLCSSSTPPGAGVHGMSGYHAAASALRSLGIRVPQRQ